MEVSGYLFRTMMKLPLLVTIMIFVSVKVGDFNPNLRSVLNDLTRDVSLGFDISCGVRGGGANRIVNGKRAEEHEFPWMVSIQELVRENFLHSCAGSIIHPEWILTAGHCIHDISMDRYRIVAGAYNLDVEEPSQQIRSVAYIKSILKEFVFDDIALMKMNETFELDGRIVAPICLPDKSASDYSGDIIYAGWGRTDDYEPASTYALRKVTTETITNQECREIYEEVGARINDCQVCTQSERRKGTCFGDSGGPGMYVKDDKFYLWGVISWGRGCSSNYFPKVNTDVRCYDDWIVKIINDN